jgi:hypothetical protein
MPIPRRDFISLLGAGGLVASGRPDPFAIAGEPPLRSIDPKWDMSWRDRITGKYRAVFDSPDVAEGAAVFRAVMWREQHTAVFGTRADELNAVVVVRHRGIPLVMDDDYWKQYEVGKALKLKDDSTHKWMTANPISGQAGGGGDTGKYTIPHFIASGGIVLACNMAFGQLIADIKQRDKVSRDEASKRAHAHLLPGIILQPSGIFAVLCAEDVGCHYIIGT